MPSRWGGGTAREERHSSRILRSFVVQVGGEGSLQSVCRVPRDVCRMRHQPSAARLVGSLVPSCIECCVARPECVRLTVWCEKRWARPGGT